GWPMPMCSTAGCGASRSTLPSCMGTPKRPSYWPRRNSASAPRLLPAGSRPSISPISWPRRRPMRPSSSSGCTIMKPVGCWRPLRAILRRWRRVQAVPHRACLRRHAMGWTRHNARVWIWRPCRSLRSIANGGPTFSAESSHAVRASVPGCPASAHPLQGLCHLASVAPARRFHAHARDSRTGGLEPCVGVWPQWGRQVNHDAPDRAAAQQRRAGASLGGPSSVPVLLLETRPPDAASFHRADYYRTALKTLGEPFFERRVMVDIEAEPTWEKKGRKTTRFQDSSELRHALEDAVRRHGVRAVILDEAQHLMHVGTGAKLLDQLDWIKS